MEKIEVDGTDLYTIQDGKKVKLEIPAEGMIGLIAYGDLGIRAWRNAKKKVYDQKMKEQGAQDKNGK